MIATAASTSTACRARGSSLRVLAGLLALAVALVAQTAALAAPAEALTGVDLSTYKRVGRFDLPEPTRTTPPANNLLAQEASGVTYDWDTDSLFVVGDGGTSVTQVSKTGALIDTMTLPPGGSPQGTEFYDTEGIAYIGNGEFVMTEERDRQAVRLTYEAGGTLTRGEVDTVKLGTTIGNVGLEGVTNDPVTGGYIFVKEIEPRSIFQTDIDWEAGTATNGGPEAVGSTDLFSPALTGLIDFSDVFALANVSTLTGPQANNLLIISQESGKVIDVDRSGNVSSSLTLIKDPGNPLTIQQQTHEGVTMDDDGVLYTVNEEGGGDADHPQLWVFEPSSEPNKAPTAVTLTNQTTSLPEGTDTSTRLKLAEVEVTDDGIGTNQYSVTGADASFFEVDNSGLYLKAGTKLNSATKSAYQVSVQVQDTTVSGSSPVTSSTYTLTVTSTSGGGAAAMAITEVSPWSSGDSPYKADWWELTNTGTKTVDLTGWKMDDDSASFASGVALNGVGTLEPGKSAIFIEGDSSKATAFATHWFGGSPPAGFQIGTYSGSGVGLGTGGDQVNVFNAAGDRVTGVAFGTSTSGRTFDNAAALGSTTAPLPTISTLSTAGVNGATTVSGETGSPGVAPVPTPVIVSEAAPWGSSDPTYGADWWELTNNSGQTLDLTGWKMDDESNVFGSAVALNGVTTLEPGKSAIFLEGDSTKANAFKTFWFGSSVLAGFQIGTYSGSGVGLGTGGDQVNVFNASGNHLTGVKFGGATTNVSFDNAAGLGSFTSPVPTISTLSKDGVNGAFVAHDQVGSPGTVKNAPPLPAVKITEVSSTSSSNSTYKADWWELTNVGATAVDPSTYKVDDESNAFGSALALSGVTSLAPGASAVFIEGTAPTAEAFKTHWFGSSPPAGFKIGTYSGSGIGLGSGGDQVNLFNSAGTKITGVRFGAATTGVSFDNAAGIGGTETPPPLISTNSAVGVNGAFAAGGEIGSPGTIVQPPDFALTVSVGGTGTGVVTSEPAGIDCGFDCDEEYEEGTEVILTAVAGEGSAFTGWSGCEAILANPKGACLVTMSAAKEVTATFTLGQHQLKVKKTGTGAGKVSSIPAGIDCGSTCLAFLDHGTEVTLEAKADPGSEFKGWSGCDSEPEGKCLVTLSSAREVTAAFDLEPTPQFALAVSKAGAGSGTVTSSPAGIDCGSACVAEFEEGSTVELTAEASAGSEFREWSGACSGRDICEVTMSEAKSVNAFFAHEKQVLTVDKSGNGTVAVAGYKPGIKCAAACSQATAAFYKGTVVVLTAKPGAGAAFTGWTSGAGTCTGTTSPCEVTMSEAQSLTAAFSAGKAIVNPQTLTLTKAGTGYGTVKATGLTCEALCTSTSVAYFGGETSPPAKKAKAPTTVTLTATSAAGSDPVIWSGCEAVEGNVCKVLMSKAQSVTARFEE